MALDSNFNHSISPTTSRDMPCPTYQNFRCATAQRQPDRYRTVNEETIGIAHASAQRNPKFFHDVNRVDWDPTGSAPAHTGAWTRTPNERPRRHARTSAP
eukprot:3850793-Prymnesium_polylepis.4